MSEFNPYSPAEQLIESRKTPEVESTPNRQIEFFTPDENTPITRQEPLVNPTFIAEFKHNYDADPEQALKSLQEELTKSGQRFAKQHNLSPENTSILLEALMKVPHEALAGFTPKATINFQTGDVFSEYFPVAKTLAKLGLRQDVTGVSIGIQTADGQVVTMRRRLGGNSSCQGFFGPAAAGYINDNPNAQTTGQLVISEIFQQLHHEIGINPREVTVNMDDVVSVDYPTNQSELLVSAQMTLTKEELLDRAKNLKDEGLDKLAEADVFYLPADKLLEILRDPECHVATQHALALALLFKNTPVWSEIVEAVKKLPPHPIKEPWQDMPAFLQKHGILPPAE